jgi:hypothetical protein
MNLAGALLTLVALQRLLQTYKALGVVGKLTQLDGLAFHPDGAHKRGFAYVDPTG